MSAPLDIQRPRTATDGASQEPARQLAVGSVPKLTSGFDAMNVGSDSAARENAGAATLSVSGAAPPASIVASKSPPLPGMAAYGTSPSAPIKIVPPVAMKAYAAENQKTKVLLLENVNQTAIDLFKRAGYELEIYDKALCDQVLMERIANVHAVGIRSKTQLTEQVLAAAKNLLVIGCFCIGTNQVDLSFAQSKGVPVFNSPFSNSRSVEIIALSRQLGERNNEMHDGLFNPAATGNCHEVRGKTLGIIGYGHIGSQLSVLAEAMGMRVLYYDILPLMPLGTARPVATCEELLRLSDFVTLHVPATPETNNMIREEQLKMMRRGSYLINNARGSVVDLAALAAALKSGHLRGAAVDVYPKEPKSNGPGFDTVLQGCPNVILTPHIGGSTEEAQRAIGTEVANALIRYLNTGATVGSVNFPEVDLRNPDPKLRTVRILNIHENVPGVLKQINKLLSTWSISKQICDSNDKVAYLMADIASKTEEDLRLLQDRMSAVPESIITRILC